ncbi:hypothetical protein [Paenibacillus ihuae]|uniref:hypothetical protein n=1 Tax=Paenibacillus ihuae TaxID=1232431 RepID=UPI0006D595A9|nr:hypothetical protein [Paenibacillus ihuae]
MKFLGMVIGGIFAAIGHTMAFIIKTAFIAVRRFTMDPANKNSIWNIQALSILTMLILCFLWLVGKFQDIVYGVGEPVFYRAIPLLLSCLLGHLIYSCPLLFKSVYAKPIIQTFLNVVSIMAVGQIIMRFVPDMLGLLISGVMFIGGIALTLYYTLHLNIRSTIFNKLSTIVEVSEMASKGKPGEKKGDSNKKGISNMDLMEMDRLDLNQIDLNKKGLP